MQQTLNEPQLQQQPRRLQTADLQLQSENGKSQWVNNFWTFCSSRLASTWLPACHLWAAFSFPFRIGSRAYDLASFSLFSKLKLNFHLNTCPALWSLTRANIGSTHTHKLMPGWLQTVPNSFLARPTNDQKFISFGFLCSLQRDCKSKQLEGQLGFMTARNWVCRRARELCGLQ